MVMKVTDVIVYHGKRDANGEDRDEREDETGIGHEPIGFLP